jgi:hypothetical protein
MSNVLLIYITLKVSKLNPYCLPCHLSEKISQNIPDRILCVLIYQSLSLRRAVTGGHLRTGQ